MKRSTATNIVSEGAQDLTLGFVSVSTHDADVSKLFPGDPSEIAALAYSGSQGEDTFSESSPCARPASRRERPLTSWIWSDDYSSGAVSNDQEQTDAAFEAIVLRGVSRVVPEPPVWKVDGARLAGTLVPRKRARSQPTARLSTSEREKRVQHVRKHKVYHSKFKRTDMTSHVAEDFLIAVHNSIRMELEDMRRCLMSIELRILDLDESDITSFYSWLIPFSDLVRLYFIACERHVMDAAEKASDMELQEDLSRNRRRAIKLKVVTDFEVLESFRRPLQVNVSDCVRFFPEIRKLAKDITRRINKLLNAEMEQLPSLLTAYFHETQVIDMFHSVLSQIHENAFGSMFLVIISRGVSESPTMQREWLRYQHQNGLRRRTETFSKTSAVKWMRKCVELHGDFVQGFVDAEIEYRAMYSDST